MNKTDRDNWRKFLGIKDPSSSLENGRTGGVIGRTAGRAGGAGGGGALDSDSVPEGSDDDESAEKGDGGADAGNRLKPGDDADRLEDLYDCETGEEVTIDGFGEKGSERYPTGFENCDAPKPPTMADLDGKTIFVCRYYSNFDSNVKEEIVYALDKSAYTSKKTKALAMANAASSKECVGQVVPTESDIGTSGVYRCELMALYGGVGCRSDGRAYISEYRTSTSTVDKQEYIDSFELKWPAVDKNHLTWNKEKGCFEPLCPELNTAVSDKFKGCEKERVLCDKDGNKVKVEVDGNGVKITQAKYNQTAEFRNGKVTAVKKLTESQTEAEFK